MLLSSSQALKAINAVFLLLVAGFTFTICLLLSASFTEEEATRWVYGVLESIAMQVRCLLYVGEGA